MSTEKDQAEHLVREAVIRRTAALGLPFMLKGSMLTRQYFAHPPDRRAVDLDWTYLEPLADTDHAKRVFDDWTRQILEAPIADGITFLRDRDSLFWQEIDYALADDFPTVTADLEYTRRDAAGQEQHEDIGVDISFNLPVPATSVPLLYQPAAGAPFEVPYATPLSLQVAWKLHHSILRTRFKDLFDLLHLLRHPAFDAATRQQALATLAAECQAANLDLRRLDHLLAGDLAALFSAEKPLAVARQLRAGQQVVSGVSPQVMEEFWQYWRHSQYPSPWRELLLYAGQASAVTDPARLPATLAEFEQQLRDTFAQAGLRPSAPLRSGPLPVFYAPGPPDLTLPTAYSDFDL